MRVGCIASLIEQFGVEPAGDRTRTAEPQRVIGVVTKLQVMGRKAGVDKGVSHRLRIEHGRLAGRLLQREDLR